MWENEITRGRGRKKKNQNAQDPGEERETPLQRKPGFEVDKEEESTESLGRTAREEAGKGGTGIKKSQQRREPQNTCAQRAVNTTRLVQ